MKRLSILILLFFVACTKIVEVEKEVSKPVKMLTNAQNREAIEQKRSELGLSEFTDRSLFLPSYSPKVGQVLYNYEGFNEALVTRIVNEGGKVVETFEGCRDSEKVFYRRMVFMTNGDFLMFPCDSIGRTNDSSSVYQFWKI